MYSCLFIFFLLTHCMVPEKIHTLPTKGIEIFYGVRSSLRAKHLKKGMKLNNWNFQRGGVVVSKKKVPSMGKVWIFSGTTQLTFGLFLDYVSCYHFFCVFIDKRVLCRSLCLTPLHHFISGRNL